MFDFVKISINDPGYAAQLYNNSLLDFIVPVNTKTAEINTHVSTAFFKGLEFLLYDSGRVLIKGSLHKYFNDGKHNYNDFSRGDLLWVVDSLKKNFNLNPDTAVIHNLEIGLNVITPFNPNVFLKSLNNYKATAFSGVPTSRPGCYKQCQLTQYLIKAYNKSAQYSLNQNVLRFELKFKKMEALRKGQITLAELCCTDFWSFCINRLLNIYDDIIINEDVYKEHLNAREQKAYETYRHPDSWEGMNHKKVFYHKKVYNEILSQHSKYSIKQIVRQLLIDKGLAVLMANLNICDNLTGVHGEKLGQSDQLNTSALLGQSDHLIIGAKYTKPPPLETRYCLTCERNISNQSINSFFCNDNRKCRDTASNIYKKQRKDEAAGLLFPFYDITQCPKYLSPDRAKSP